MSEENTSQPQMKPFSRRDHARIRPGMYIGGTDHRALHTLLFEAIADPIEDAFLGFCDHLWITLYPNDVINLRDNSRGLPVDVLRDGARALEWIMTEMGTSHRHGEYRVPIGVGLPVVNGLSEECTVEVTRDGFLWQQSYREGVPQTEVLQVRPMHEGKSTGTNITFRPDFTIFERNSFNYDVLANRARELAYLLPNLTLMLRDERQEPVRQEEFHFSNGLADYVADLNRDRKPLHPPLFGSVEWTIKPTDKWGSKVAVDIALQYTDTLDTQIVSYINTMPLTSGRHVDTLPFALSTFMNGWADFEREGRFSSEECLPELTAVVSVKHAHPTFLHATNKELANLDVVGVVFAAVNAALQTTIRLNAYDAIKEKLLANRHAISLKKRPTGHVAHLQDQRLRLKRRRGNRS